MEVTIRPALARNLFTVSFGVLWCLGLTSVGSSFLQSGLWFMGLLPLCAAVLGAVIFWRMATASVKTSERGIRVCNVLSTIQVPWNSVADIRIARLGAFALGIGPGAGSWRRGLELVLSDGQTISVDVLSEKDAYPGLIAGRRLDAALGLLRDRFQRVA